MDRPSWRLFRETLPTTNGEETGAPPVPDECGPVGAGLDPAARAPEGLS